MNQVEHILEDVDQVPSDLRDVLALQIPGQVIQVEVHKVWEVGLKSCERKLGFFTGRDIVVIFIVTLTFDPFFQGLQIQDVGVDIKVGHNSWDAAARAPFSSPKQPAEKLSYLPSSILEKRLFVSKNIKGDFFAQ